MNNAVTTNEKNPFTGAGYDKSTSQGRMLRIADFMKHPNITTSIQNVIPNNERSKAFVASVLNEIRKSSTDSDKDLTVCTPDSIVNCCIDAANMGLAIDGRQHAHLIKRGANATLQIGYRGYLDRLGKHLKGFVPVVECVYKADAIIVGRKGDQAICEHTPANPFGTQNDTDVVGAYAYLSWMTGNKRVSVVTTIDRATINKIMAVAKTKSIWNAWFTEKVKVAVIRRACKMHFSALTDDLDRADNDNFDLALERDTSEETKGIAKRIGEGLSETVSAEEPRTVEPEVMPADGQTFTGSTVSDPENFEPDASMGGEVFDDPEFLEEVRQRELREGSQQ